MKKKKKPSPFRLRRNQKRKEDFLKKKLENSTITFKCDQCENVFNSEKGLKIHKGKVHKKAEVLRSDDPESSSLKSSPQKEVLREEQSTSPPSQPSPPSHLWARLLRGYILPPLLPLTPLLLDTRLRSLNCPFLSVLVKPNSVLVYHVTCEL